MTTWVFARIYPGRTKEAGKRIAVRAETEEAAIKQAQWEFHALEHRSNTDCREIRVRLVRKQYP